MSPTATDERADARLAADEWYEYPGSDNGNPPCWVARIGLLVLSATDGREVDAVELGSVEQARAYFAEETCDPGPGMPQAGDLIRIVWGEFADDEFVVESAEYVEGWDLFVVTGHPALTLSLAFGQYVIESRPEGNAS